MIDLDIDEKYRNFKAGNIDDKFESLKIKVESKKCSKKEYKEYLKICNLKENTFMIDNLMNYINDLKQKILLLKEEKEKRQIYRELQKRELYLIAKIKSLDEEYIDLRKLLKVDDFDEEEKNIIENQIINIINKNAAVKDELEKIRSQIKEKEQYQTKKIYSYEEQKIMIIKIKEKINHASMVLDYLLKGNSWDETLEYYMEWQKSKYNLNSKDLEKIGNDIKKIRYDTEMGNEIVKIAYNYDGIKKKEEYNEEEHNEEEYNEEVMQALRNTEKKFKQQSEANHTDASLRPANETDFKGEEK